MASRRDESEIDRLYQLGPDEFTAARNALAKEAGADAPAIRKLTKPPIAAWAVNQLFWKQRPLYDAMIEAAKELRQTHKAILAGRKGDLRSAGKAHETALDAAAKGTLALLKESGHPATDATRQAIVTTLRALPADEEPGRLTRTLQPGGFEALAGLSIGGAGAAFPPRKEPAAESRPVRPSPKPAKSSGEKLTPREKAEAAKQTQRQKAEAAKITTRLKADASKARNELREAENRARREEFEAARGAREADKAAKRLVAAREALAAAQQEVDDAESEAASTGRTKEAAERRASETERALAAARARADAADAAVKAHS